MNEQEQNVAIAIACGSKWMYNPNAEQPVRILLHPGCVTSMDDELVEAPMSIPPETESWMYDMLPDYVNDLDAMHEAEKVLCDDERNWFKYIMTLRKMFEGQGDIDWCLLHATSQQRAEAFLKTLGLWKEEWDILGPLGRV